MPTGFLTATGTSVGDTVTITFSGRQVPVRIVGEVFDTSNSGLEMLTDWQTLASRRPGAWQPAPGTTSGYGPAHHQRGLRRKS